MTLEYFKAVLSITQTKYLYSHNYFAMNEHKPFDNHTDNSIMNTKD